MTTARMIPPSDAPATATANGSSSLSPRPSESVLVTTRQAADLCGVHPSTVKRWCDSGEVACEHTPGGHRRIDLAELLRFAAASDVPTALDGFGPHAAAVWTASRAALDGDRDLGGFVSLWHGWAIAGQDVLIARSMIALHIWGVALGRLFDDGLAAVLRTVGDAWRAGRLGIGEEHRLSEQIMDALHRFRHAVSSHRWRPEQRADDGADPRHTAVVAGAPGNAHAVGPFLARLVLESRGWCVRYLGADVPSDELIEQQRAAGAGLVCVSFGRPQVPADALRLSRQMAAAADAGPAFRLVMGGAPLTAVDEVVKPPFGHVLPSMTAFEAWLDAEYPSTDLNHATNGVRR